MECVSKLCKGPGSHEADSRKRQHASNHLRRILDATLPRKPIDAGNIDYYRATNNLEVYFLTGYFLGLTTLEDRTLSHDRVTSVIESNSLGGSFRVRPDAGVRWWGGYVGLGANMTESNGAQFSERAHEATYLSRV